MKEDELIGYLCSIVQIPILLVFLVFVAASGSISESERTVLVIIASIALAVSIGILVGVILFFERRKKTPEESNKTLREIAEMENPSQFPLSDTSRGDDPYDNHKRITTIDAILTNHNIDESSEVNMGFNPQEYEIKAIVFEGGISGEKCQICKLELRKDQIILKCPSCDKLFHRNHLEEWLQKTTECPVCGFKLKIRK